MFASLFTHHYSLFLLSLTVFFFLLFLHGGCLWHSEGTHAEIYFVRDVIAIFLSVIILMIISDGIISTLPARIQNFPQRHHPFDYGEDVQGVAEPTCKALLSTS